MQIFLMILLHIVECLKMANTLLMLIAILLFANLVLTHTNIKTWVQKAKWGVVHGFRLLDRKLVALVDNRKR